MKECGIMEILLLTTKKKQMRREDGKQEIYLEWPYNYIKTSSLIRWQSFVR